MNKFTDKPLSLPSEVNQGKYYSYNLSENPFPANPIVNKDSEERIYNGSIYESAIREKEFNTIKTNFLTVSQMDANHLRLGFIIDSSYIGRGNGKSAFLVNLNKEINKNYCLDISDKKNKCFSIYLPLEGGGSLKTFEKFGDLIFHTIVKSKIIDIALATIRLNILDSMQIKIDLTQFKDDDELINKVNSEAWYDQLEIDTYTMANKILESKYLQDIPPGFPLNSKGFIYEWPKTLDFIKYYESLKKGRDQYQFIFGDLIGLFLTAEFNGAYILVDDFERVPDFQSAIQKKDFATQLRSILFDGPYKNSRIGFFNFILALHAGVPRLIQEAWELSGMEQRVSLAPSYPAKHIVMFERITEKHALLLIKKYLNEFRLKESEKKDDLFPFTIPAVNYIGKVSEMNASKILQLANNLLDYAASNKISTIDEELVKTYTDAKYLKPEEKPKDLTNTNTIDLIKKSQIE